MILEENPCRCSKPSYFSRAELAEGIGSTQATISAQLHGDPEVRRVLGAVANGKQWRVPKPSNPEDVPAFFREKRGALAQLGKRYVAAGWERAFNRCFRGGLTEDDQRVLWLA